MDCLKGLNAGSNLFFGRVVFQFLFGGALFPNICWWEKHSPRWLEKRAPVRTPGE